MACGNIAPVMNVFRRVQEMGKQCEAVDGRVAAERR